MNDLKEMVVDVDDAIAHLNEITPADSLGDEHDEGVASGLQDAIDYLTAHARPERGIDPVELVRRIEELQVSHGTLSHWVVSYVLIIIDGMKGESNGTNDSQ